MEEGEFEDAAAVAVDALDEDGTAAAGAAGLQALAARGVESALLPLARCALEGRGMERNRAQALGLLEAAAAPPGVIGARARCCLAACVMQDGEFWRERLDVADAEGTPPPAHLARAFQLLVTSAAESGEAVNFFYLARAHLRGIGTAMDAAAGAAALQHAADLGDEIALYDLGECYRLGVGVRKDKARARALRARAREEGFEGKRELGAPITETCW